MSGPSKSKDLHCTPKINVNYAPAEELRLIQGVGYRIAEIILYLREMHGNIGSDLLSNLLRKPLPPSVLKYLDFSQNPAYQGGGEGREARWEGPSTPKIWGRVEEHVGGGMDLLNLGTSQETDQKQNVYQSSAFTMASGMVDSSIESVPSMKVSKMVDPIPNSVKSRMEPKMDATSSLKLEDISSGEETSKKTNRGQQMKTLQQTSGSSKEELPDSCKKKEGKKNYGDGTIRRHGPSFPRIREGEDGHRTSKVKASLSSEDTDTDCVSKSDTPVAKLKKSKRKPALSSVPKLYYEGDDDWDIFKNKFQDYAEEMDWTPSECKACLKWCLRGKAAKFCSTLLKINEDLTYKQLLRKLGDRFGDLDLKVAVYSQFNHANQKEEESLEDWADRVRELAAKAFKDLPNEYCCERAVQRFCEGMTDGEAGQYVFLGEPTSLEEAIKRTRLFQYTKKACHRKDVEKSTALDYDDTPEVCTVTEHRDLGASFKKMEQQQKIIEEQQNLIEMLLLDRKLEVEDHRCFFCREVGHLKRDCKKLLRQKSKKNTQ